MKCDKRLFLVCVIIFGLKIASDHVLAQSGSGLIAADQRRYLIIDAQDLGMAAAIDKATIEASGAITSVGVMVPSPWFLEVVRWAHSHPDRDLGIRLDLNAEWAAYRWPPVSSQTAGSGLRDSAGYLPRDASYVGQYAKADAVAVEFRAQINA